jgi:predicted nuclease of predicted toxin-antitoxin system
VLDIGLAGASDVEIREHASRNDYVVISKDADFLYLANASASKARFIWIRFGNCRTKVLLASVESLWPKVEKALKAGDRVIELRRSIPKPK